MTTQTLDPATTPTTGATHPARAAGIGGVLAFSIWLLQPLAVFWLVADEEILTWASLERVRWLAPYEVVTFLLLALGTWLLVDGIERQLVDRREASPLAAAGRAAGYVAVLGWVLLVTSQSSLFSSASSDLADLAVPDQTAALAIQGVVQMSGLHLAALGGAAWLAMVGTHARRCGVVGRVTGWAALVAALVAVAPFAVPFSAPWGSIGVVLMSLWLGVQQLRFAARARRAGS